MSPFQKDLNEKKGTDLKRDLSAPSQSRTEDKGKAASSQSNVHGKVMHDRSKSIRSDGMTSDPSDLSSPFDIEADRPLGAQPNRPILLEKESGHHNTQACSLGLDSASTIKGPGAGERRYPTTVSDTPFNPSAQSATERDTPYVSPSAWDGNCSSGSETSSSTGSTVTDSDVLGELKKPPSGGLENLLGDVESPSDSETSRSTGDTVTDADISAGPENDPPPTLVADSATRNSPRLSQASKTCRWALLYVSGICCLIVVALTVACQTGYESQSVGHSKLCNQVFQARAEVTSAYVWTQRTTQQLHQRLPALRAPPRHSSGEQLGAGIGHIYTNLSQALAAGNSLFRAPSLIIEKRAQAMRFRLPEGSLTSEPLQLFVRLSHPLDEKVLELILKLGQVAGVALRQHQETIDTLHSIQRAEYFGTFRSLRIRFVGTAAQESRLQSRLGDHFGALNESITAADRQTRELLQDYILLASTASRIRESAVQDRERLLLQKEKTASQWNWVFRASMQMLGLPEPEDLAKISYNIDLAQDIQKWAEEVVEFLQLVLSHLQYAKTDIGLLTETLNKHGTIIWDVADKERKLQEFLALVMEGLEILSYNRAGWLQLQWAGYLSS